MKPRPPHEGACRIPRARSKRGSDMKTASENPELITVVRGQQRTTRGAAQVVRGQPMQNPRGPIVSRAHFGPRPAPPRRPTAKLEFAAMQHYLVVDRSAHPLRAASVRRTASLLPGCRSLSKPGALSRAGLSLSRRAVVAGEDISSFAHHRNGCFRDRRSRAPIDRRYTSSVRSAGRSSRAGS